MSSVMPLESSLPDFKQALVTMTVKILRPLVKILLRHGLSSQEFTEISRWVYVDVAMQEREFRLGERKQSKSRVAVLTGLSRKEVLRLTDAPRPEENEDIQSHNRAARVVLGWTENPIFHDSSHKPKSLRIKGGGATFENLVRMYSGDMPYRAVLDELERCGVVTLEKDQTHVTLCKDAYIPNSGSPHEVNVVGTCASDLLATMEHNFRDGNRYKKPQKAAYSLRVPTEKIPEIREWIRQQTDEFIKSAHQRILASADNVQTPGKSHSRVGVGVYYFD